MIRLQAHVHGPSFRTLGLRGGALPMGHVLNVDHFVMSQPTFPPHPHAGFSAVTWMLPWSDGGFVNRDSLGDRSLIRPGTLHWTMAAAGMIHEEIPERPGVPCEGLQIFVKLPESHELIPPAAYHAERADLPVERQAGGEAWVFVGALGGAVGPVPSHARTMMAHASIRDRFVVDVPDGVEAFVVALRGAGAVDGRPIVAGEATALAAGRRELAGAGLEALVSWSDPMAGRPSFQGPFCMFSPVRLMEAAQRYRAGGMGALAPSFGR